jgi:hypothetical protein
MTDAQILQRLRRFLVGAAGLLFAGTVAELVLVGHTESFTQLIPFALCVLGLGAAAAASFGPPRRAALHGLRVVSVLAALGSLYGVYEHVAGNVALQREVSPNASGGEFIMGALDGGNPLLAPGVLTLAAALALAATYRHPALSKQGTTGDRAE